MRIRAALGASHGAAAAAEHASPRRERSAGLFAGPAWPRPRARAPCAVPRRAHVCWSLDCLHGRGGARGAPWFGVSCYLHYSFTAGEPAGCGKPESGRRKVRKRALFRQAGPFSMRGNPSQTLQSMKPGTHRSIRIRRRRHPRARPARPGPPPPPGIHAPRPSAPASTPAPACPPLDRNPLFGRRRRRASAAAAVPLVTGHRGAGGPPPPLTNLGIRCRCSVNHYLGDGSLVPGLFAWGAGHQTGAPATVVAQDQGRR